MQANGNLAEQTLRSLLESAQSERATGTLNVRNGQHACSIYFLFGHLFHAVAGDATGDDAVVDALTWSRGEYSFDTKAKLPPDESVRMSIPELIERAGPLAETEAVETNAESAETDEGAWTEPSEPPPVEAGAAGGDDATAGGASLEPAADEWSAPSAADEAPGSAATWNEVEVAAPTPVAPAPAPAPAEPAVRSEDQPKRGVRHRPEPPSGRETVPVPAGQVIYDSLKTSFVDFPRLVRTLEREDYTGYVRLVSEKASGLILFSDGRALECVFDPGRPQLGPEALSAFNAEVTNGQGVLDVISLDGELVQGLHELIVASPVYADLYSSWVDVPKLLAFLNERRLTGSLMARASGGTGVIILNAGSVVGAYTSESREIAREVDSVLALCTDPMAVIEVRSSDQRKRPPLDVEGVLGGQPGATNRVATAAAAPVETMAGQSQNATDAQPAPPPQPLSAPEWAPPPAPMEEPAPALSPSPGSGGAVDWEQVVTDLQGMAEDALGNRSRKVKDILGAAERSRAGVEGAIDQVPAISLLFVDSSRLESLAQEMRGKLQTYL